MKSVIRNFQLQQRSVSPNDILAFDLLYRSGEFLLTIIRPELPPGYPRINMTSDLARISSEDFQLREEMGKCGMNINHGVKTEV